MKVLVTGGYGFIGSHFIRMSKGCGFDVLNVDAETYASNPDNISGLGVETILTDICDRNSMDTAFGVFKPDCVVNFAAESHVDRSIQDSTPFATTNFLGVQVLLDLCVQRKVGRFIQISTDEVYGDRDGLYEADEKTHLAPSSPYSASKAGADLMVLSYVRTHKLNAVITRCSNNYGPMQFPEKLIPVAIKKLLYGHRVPVYGDGMQTRDWIHVRDHCRGILAVMECGEPGQVYNFSSGIRLANLELVKLLAKLTGRETGDVNDYVEFVTDRQGHDRLYWLSHQKALRELLWAPEVNLVTGMSETVEWYKDRL